MKILFLLDNNESVEVDPTALQLRQIASGQSALGITLTVPTRNEDGSPKVVDGVTETQQVFRPFVNFAVDLVLPKPAEPAAPPAQPPAVDESGASSAPPNGKLQPVPKKSKAAKKKGR